MTGLPRAKTRTSPPRLGCLRSPRSLQISGKTPGASSRMMRTSPRETPGIARPRLSTTSDRVAVQLQPHLQLTDRGRSWKCIFRPRSLLRESQAR